MDCEDYQIKLENISDNAEMNDEENESFEENENLWITITTCNKMGRKATINRCLLFPLSPEPLNCD